MNIEKNEENGIRTESSAQISSFVFRYSYLLTDSLYCLKHSE